MYKSISNILNLILLTSALVFSLKANAQEVRVIDNKGTITNIRNNTVTTATTAPTNPVENDVWFDTTTNLTKIWDGSSWKSILSENTIGDIKTGVQLSDHNGWYLLNGRAITTLSTSAQAAASSLNLGTNLPNATDRVLKHPSSGQTVGSNGGQSTTTLVKDNIPNYNIPITTSTDGIHNHSFTIGNLTSRAVSLNNGTPNANIAEITSGTGSTTSNGDHNHTATVNTGGNGLAFERYQPYLVVNIFIFLGL